MHPIARYRRALGLTQDELSKALGVSTFTIQRWETGAAPRPRFVPRLAETLGVESLTLSDQMDGWRAANPAPAATA